MKSSITSKPTPLKWAKGISIFQISVGVIYILFFIWLFNFASNTDFVLGMQNGIAEGMGRDASFFSGPEGTGYVTGRLAASLLGPIFCLLAIARQSKNWSIASLLLNGAAFLTSFTPLTLVVIILMLQKSSRDYLQLSK